MVVTRSLTLTTLANGQVIDVNAQVSQAVAESGLRAGIVTIFVAGTTAGVTIMEFEPGLVMDLAAAMERLVPRGIPYQHNILNNDDNGHSHTQATLVGPSIVVPFSDGKLMLGTWQRVVLIDFDSRARERRLVLQVMGE